MLKTLKIAASVFLISFCLNMLGAEQHFYLGYDTISISKTQQSVIGNNYHPYFPELQYVIPTPPGGTMLYTYVEGTWELRTLEDFEIPFQWYPDPNGNFGQGKAGIIYAGTNFNLVLCGKIPVGEVITVVSNFYDPNIYRNFSLLASKIPKEGLLTTDLGFQPRNGDIIYLPVGATNAGGNINYQVHLYDQLVNGWWPSEPFVKKNTGFWHRSLTYGNIVWKQTMFNETNDGREHSIVDAGYSEFLRGNALFITCIQKPNETLIVEYGDGVSWTYQMGTYSPPSTESTVTFIWYARQGWESGIIRIRAITP